MPKIVRRPFLGIAPEHLDDGCQPRYTHAHYCPACRDMHDYAVDGPMRGGSQWSFNGDFERPTFSPSMKITWGRGSAERAAVCHYFVTDGQILYCADSTHALAGKTVNLPDIPADEL